MPVMSEDVRRYRLVALPKDNPPESCRRGICACRGFLKPVICSDVVWSRVEISLWGRHSSLQCYSGGIRPNSWAFPPLRLHSHPAPCIRNYIQKAPLTGTGRHSWLEGPLCSIRSVRTAGRLQTLSAKHESHRFNQQEVFLSCMRLQTLDSGSVVSRARQRQQPCTRPQGGEGGTGVQGGRGAGGRETGSQRPLRRPACSKNHSV